MLLSISAIFFTDSPKVNPGLIGLKRAEADSQLLGRPGQMSSKKQKIYEEWNGIDLQ